MPFDASTLRSKLTFFNTETRKKEQFKSINEGKVRMYTCGPTVYDYAHIGNFRTYIFEDILRRSLKFFGYEVEQVMNLTDVDDKTIKGANKEGVTLDEFTKRYKDAFFEDMETLNVEKVEHYPAATDHVREMIDLIHCLLDKGVAYTGSDGSVYYAIDKFEGYGRLAHLKLDELQVRASERVASDEYDKDNVADFVLWKAYDEERDGKIFWDSPFGKGRPGWHLECSAMAMKILGETIDIHCGGVDNIFPHHENEIAQSEACSGKQFARYWMHSEHLIVDNKKMSKSLGNFFTLRSLLDKGFTGQQVRYLLMQTHYKTQLNFTMQGLDAAKHSLQRLHDFLDRLEGCEAKDTGEVQPHCEKAFEAFAEALADDLNVSVALAAAFDLVREINALCDQGKVGKGDAQGVRDLLDRFDTVLGVMTFVEAEVPADINQMLEQRQQARKDRDWDLADRMRDAIISRGFVIEDTVQGARVKKA